MIYASKPKISSRIGTVTVDVCCNMAGIKPNAPDDLKGLKLLIAHMILIFILSRTVPITLIADRFSIWKVSAG